MYLIAGSSFDLINFFKILGWILFPVLAGSVILTIFLHYRKKKKNTTEEELLSDSAEQIGYTRGDGEYILFDHSPLIREYKDRLSYFHARYSALKQDYDRIATSPAPSLSENPINMNHYTDEATPITSGTVTSPAYFEDVIGQKNAQIHFLQQQLDNRIHQQHLADQGLSEMTEQLSVAKAANDQLAEALHIRDGELAETRHQLAVLENDYNELCRQNEILGTSASDSRDMVTLLQDKIDMQQTEMLRISQAAERKAEILSKMHDELGRLLEGPGKETVPVLAVAG